MGSAFNLGKYNLTGYNVTPQANIFVSIRFAEKILFIATTIVNNIYPKVNIFERINKKQMVVICGRYANTAAKESIAKAKAVLLGISWRNITIAENVEGNAAALGYFWKKATCNNEINIAGAELFGISWRPIEVSENIGIATANMLGVSWRHVDISETVYGRMLGFRYYWKRAASNDAINISRADLLGASWRTVAVTENIDNIRAEILGYFWQCFTSMELVLGNARLSNIAKPFTQMRDSLQGKFYPSEIALIPAEMKDSFSSSPHLSQEVHETFETLDLIDAFSSILSLEYKTCVLNVTLEPGDEMIIDANTFNVWINQENAVYVHEGDWLDELDRSTQDILISAASGARNIAATILYTERYL